MERCWREDRRSLELRRRREGEGERREEREVIKIEDWNRLDVNSMFCRGRFLGFKTQKKGV